MRGEDARTSSRALAAVGAPPRAWGGRGVVDPEMVQTPPELAAGFNQLRGPRSYTDLGRAVRPQRLPASTPSNLLNGTSVPRRDSVVTFLTACGLDEQAQGPWLAAWERVSTAHLRRPVGAVRVRDARPRLLGVHAAIHVDGAAEELPGYVPRDLDADLRTAITAAANEGGFVLLVGGASVGKTRALFEAVRVVVPEWWVVHPTTDGGHHVPGVGGRHAADGSAAHRPSRRSLTEVQPIVTTTCRPVRRVRGSSWLHHHGQAQFAVSAFLRVSALIEAPLPPAAAVGVTIRTSR